MHNLAQSVGGDVRPLKCNIIKGAKGVAYPLVDFVILAEFDIDSGSTVRHQFPSAIPNYAEDYLANMMLPEGLHNRSSDFTYIFLNRNDKQIDEQDWNKIALPPITTVSNSSGDTEAKFFLYGINLVKTQRDEKARRGASVKAICIFSRYHFIESLKKPLEIALDAYFHVPSVDILAKLFHSLNAVDLTLLPRPTILEHSLMRRGVGVSPQFLGGRALEHQPQNWNHALDIKLSFDAPIEGEAAVADSSSPHAVSPMSISVPLFRCPDEVGDINISKLVKTFGEGTMRIYNAILRQKRVLFVGYNHASNDVAQMVFSAVALVSPVIPNIIRRAFSYANLTDLTFLDVKGFIAGVTNPMFQQKETWWDLLCVLDLPNGKGSIVSSEDKGSRMFDDNLGGSSSSRNRGGGHSDNGEDNAHLRNDSRFFATIVAGMAANYGEEWIRQKFLDLTSSIVSQAQDQPSLLYSTRLSDKVRKQLESNVYRVAQIKRTPELQHMPPHPWIWSETPCEGYELRMHVRRLQCEGTLAVSTEVEPMFTDLLQVLQTETDAQALLSMLPESEGGLWCIAVGLFCQSPIVRMSAVKILSVIRQYESTRAAFDAMNTVMSASYHQQMASIEGCSLLTEVEEYKKKQLKLNKAAPDVQAETSQSHSSNISPADVLP